MSRPLRFVLVLLAVGACDRRYAHARCIQSTTEAACSVCCVEEGFAEEVDFKEQEQFVSPDCFCLTPLPEE